MKKQEALELSYTPSFIAGIRDETREYLKAHPSMRGKELARNLAQLPYTKQAKAVVRALAGSANRDIARLEEYEKKTGFTSPPLEAIREGGGKPRIKQSYVGDNLINEIYRARSFITSHWSSVSKTRQRLIKAGFDERVTEKMRESDEEYIGIEITNAFRYLERLDKALYEKAMSYASDRLVPLLKAMSNVQFHDSRDFRKYIIERISYEIGEYKEYDEKHNYIFDKILDEYEDK